jgi:hypothetical protein
MAGRIEALRHAAEIKPSRFLGPGGGALEAIETDQTTGQTGYMIASAANGFMNTSPADCSGTPFNFAQEYSSARAQNFIPWGFGPYMINSQFEIGHFEPCPVRPNPNC